MRWEGILGPLKERYRAPSWHVRCSVKNAVERIDRIVLVDGAGPFASMRVGTAIQSCRGSRSRRPVGVNQIERPNATCQLEHHESRRRRRVLVDGARGAEHFRKAGIQRRDDLSIDVTYERCGVQDRSSGVVAWRRRMVIKTAGTQRAVRAKGVPLNVMGTARIEDAPHRVPSAEDPNVLVLERWEPGGIGRPKLPFVRRARHTP